MSETSTSETQVTTGTVTYVRDDKLTREILVYQDTAPPEGPWPVTTAYNEGRGPVFTVPRGVWPAGGISEGDRVTVTWTGTAEAHECLLRAQTTEVATGIRVL